MKTLRYILPFMLLILATSVLEAQSAKMRRAMDYMDNLQYSDAITLFNEVLEKDDNAQAKITLADAYRKINDWANAEFWYGQVVRLPESQPIHKLYYGQSLQRNGKCELAREWYTQYVETVPDDLRGQYLSRACDYEEELMTQNDGIYEVTHLDINSDLDDFSPAYYGDGLVFASDRDRGAAVRRTHTWTGNPFLELYFVERKKMEGPVCGDFAYSRPDKFNGELNSKFHEAAVTFSADQQTIFFTRNNFNDGKVGKSDDRVVKLKVYSAQSAGEAGKWGDLESLPFNSDEYSVAHPTLSLEGDKLYFASDMPGGFGGMDLYLSSKENGRWGPPLNLGPEVNTEGNELFPFLHRDGRLFFASDGHIGLGGLDLYSIKMKNETQWELPENLGYPLNTLSDDFGLIFNEAGTCGYFSSDREGGAGRDDIYSFKKISAPIEIYVFDEKTQQPIEGAVVINQCNGKELISDASGFITIDQKLGKCCLFAATAEGYDPNEQEGCTTMVEAGEPVVVKIPMSQERIFTLEGIVFDEGNGLPLEGATVTLMNDCNGEILTPVVTDLTGRFVFELESDCCYKVVSEKTNYLADQKEEICTRGKTESEKFNARLYLKPYLYDQSYSLDNQNPNIPGTYKDVDTGLWIDEDSGLPADGEYGDVTIKGGEIIAGDPGAADDFIPTPGLYSDGEAIPFLLHIYYDFDQAFIRDDAVAELNKLQALMERNDKLIVEISSHTDARGSKRYNKKLSQRRAESVAAWLAERGIEADRLVARGYGEQQKVNNCDDYVPCTEREHQLNRRTEFRILGCRDCVEPEQVDLSKPNDSVKVDPCAGCPF